MASGSITNIINLIVDKVRPLQFFSRSNYSVFNNNLNNFSSGIYWVNNTSNTITNCPSSAGWVIVAYPITTHGFQIWVHFSNAQTYVRGNAGGTWTDWRKVTMT